jgi:exonuclease III
VRPSPAPAGSRDRWLDIDLPECGFGIGVFHILAAGSGATHPTNIAKTRFWNAVLRAAKARLEKPFLFAGDWNTGAHKLDEAGKTFYCAEHFGRLSTLGWTDLWRRHNPGVTEYTWFSKFKGGARGNGFRLDHAFATPSLLARVKECRYSHAQREAGISDHSLVIVEVGEATMLAS